QRKKVPFLNQDQNLNHDQRMVQLAKKISGLGGLFINKSGQLAIYLTDPATQKAKAAAIFSSFTPLTKSLARLRGVSQKYRSASVSNMIVKKGRYTFIQLQRWRIQVSGKILTMKGVYSNGIDESLNKLTIGVKNNAVKERVIKKLVQLN